jgi:peptidoglycan hydrolase-like protein with peptidoglycan-binding domain/tetratricopeptide (TPR) repeat protein
MQVIQSGLRRPKNYGHAAWCALAIGAVALAFPTTAVAAQSGRKSTTIAANGAPPGATPLGQTVLALGSGYSSPDGSPLVRVLQRDLELGGYPPGAVDGLFGPRTRQAVIAFQTSHGLQVDGVAGPHTWADLNGPGPMLGPGAGNLPSGSKVVRSLQRRLALAGDSPGPIDGRFGALTEGAVRRFQRAHGLSLTGVAGPRVLALLSGPAQRRNPVRSSSNRSLRRPNPVLPQTAAPLPTATTPSPPPGSSLARTSRRGPHSLLRGAPRTPGHPASLGAVPGRIILGGLAFALVLLLAAPLLIAAVRRRRSRSGDRSDIALPAGSEADSAVGQELTDVALGKGHDEAARSNGAQTARTNGARIHTNGDGASHDPDETREDADKRPPGTEPQDLPEWDEGVAAFNLGLMVEAQGSMLEAEAAYRRADELGHGIAASNLGRLLEEQGALAEAEAAYRRADERGDAIGAFRLGRLLERRYALGEAAAAYRRASARGHNTAASNLGILLAECGSLREAEAEFRRADERGDADAAFNLGVVLQRRGALVDAEAAYRRAEQRGGGEVVNMARAALLDVRARLQEAGSGQSSGAGLQTERCRAPDRTDGTGNGARGWTAGGKPEVLAESPEAADAFELGRLLEAQGSVLDAQAAYRRADEGGHGTAASNLGRLLEEQGALAEAEAAYRRADERGDAAGAFNLAALLEDRNALEDAAAAYGRAAERGHGGAASNLGVLLTEQGALDEAEAAFRSGDERGDPSAAFNLAVLLEERGALTEATEAYRRAEQRGDGEVASSARAALRDLRAGLQEAGIGPSGVDDA